MNVSCKRDGVVEGIMNCLPQVGIGSICNPMKLNISPKHDITQQYLEKNAYVINLVNYNRYTEFSLHLKIIIFLLQYITTLLLRFYVYVLFIFFTKIFMILVLLLILTNTLQ